MYMEMEINMVNKFYGDGDHHENKGHTDSQLCACHSERFTTTCDIVEVERPLANFELSCPTN